MNAVHTEVYKNHTIKIIPDLDFESPEAWEDTNLYLVANVARHLQVREKESDEICENRGKKPGYFVFPVSAYIHSGIALSLGGPKDMWDSGMAGFIVASKKEFKSRAQAKKVATNLIEAWNQCLNGDVYGYTVSVPEACVTCGHIKSNNEDSLWGIYGQDEALRQAKEFVDYPGKSEADSVLLNSPIAGQTII